MFIKRYITGPIDVNTYLVADEETKDAIVIDLGGNWETIRQDAEKFGFKINFILLTHGHFDHVLGIPEMKKNEKIPVLMNENDLFLTNNMVDTIKHFRINSDVKSIPIDKLIDETTPLKVGNYDIKIFHTPGHTPGGQSYLIDGNLFSGDSLFRHSIGRTDLALGNYDDLIDSIKTKLFTLPKNTKVYPGHDSFSSIGDEIENNIYVR